MSDTVEEKLLYFSRHGNADEVTALLEQNPSINIDYKGECKSTKCWSALHLSSYFGHKAVVELLLEKGANPDIVNDTGDTPLHKAAYTNREEVVRSLLEHGASSALVNEERKKASDIAINANIKNILEASEKVQVTKQTMLFFQSVKEGRVDDVEKLLSDRSVLVDINSSDERGNTALHHAAMRDQRPMTLMLLQHGANTSKLNKDGELPLDVSKSIQMKKLLEVKPKRHPVKIVQRFEGPLMKRKRFLGPQWHWVVLERGVISYFSKRADAATGSKRRLFKYLTEAKVTPREDNNWSFTIHYFDGSHHNLMVHQRNKPLINRKKWLDALNEHMEYSNHFVVAERPVSDTDSNCDDATPVVPLVRIKNVLQDAKVHEEVLKSNVEALTVLVQKLAENMKQPPNADSQRLSSQVLGNCHEILTTSSEMSKSFTKCLQLFQQRDQAVEVKLSEEKEKNRVLQQALQSLATTHHNLEQTISSQGESGSPTKEMPSPPDYDGDERSINDDERHHSVTSRSTSSGGGFLSDDEEFFDAVSEGSDDDEDTEEFDTSSLSDARLEAAYEAVYEDDGQGGATRASAPRSRQLSYNHSSNGGTAQHLSRDDKTLMPRSGVKNDAASSADAQSVSDGEPKYRESLPVAMFSRDEFSIWHILRQCIGKELSKITMPVIFNEPLSFIQRLCEYMEYSRLLESANRATDSLERIQFVAAFAVSALGSQLNRLGKPFNPLLGETYEYQRPDLGFTWAAEQVSHHPPISAFHAAGTNPDHPFVFHGCIHPKLKFWGKTVEIEPKGVLTLTFPEHDETYTWTNPKCSVHNIVVGKLWIEQHGVMEIANHKTNEKCVVTFKPYSWLRNDLNKVEGHVFTASKEKVRIIEGDWTKHIYSLSVDAHERFLGMGAGTVRSKSKSKSHSVSSDDASSYLESLLNDGEDCKCLWKASARPVNSDEMYNMTRFAMSLNELQVRGYDLPPTDSRFRPDIRCLEDGDIDGASEQKHRVEEKQRAARKLRNKKKSEWTPRWFVKAENPATKASDWLFKGEYTKRDWTGCPDIF